jgi:DNA-binding LytR/AlgR family response regulator
MTIARNIMDMENPPQIIISTAYDKYAVMGFEISVADYILKPFSLDRIKRAIKKAVGNIDDKTISGKNNDDEILRKIAVCRENRMFLIDISDVYYFESKGNDVEIVTLSYVYKAAMTLKSLENSLDENKFIRIHKSFIVNADYIDEIIPWFNYTCKILLKDSMGELMVSRSNYKDFKEKFRI